MSNIHEQLDQLIAAQNKTNELLQLFISGGNTSAAKTETKEETKSSKSKSKSKAKEEKKAPAVSVQEANDAAIALKDAHGVAVVKEILSANGVAKLAQMKEDQAEGVYKACLAKQAELDDDAGEDDDI